MFADIRINRRCLLLTQVEGHHFADCAVNPCIAVEIGPSRFVRAAAPREFGVDVLLAGVAHLAQHDRHRIARDFGRRTHTDEHPFAGALHEQVRTAFDGGIGEVGKLLVNWSPVGLLYQAISTGLSALGVSMPAKFSEFGGMLMTGLINGITSMAGSVKESIVGVGDSVVGWFREKLGIHSPSRVFAELGANVSEGAAQGITGGQGLVRNAALGLAAATAVTMAPPVLGAVPPVPAQFGAPAGQAPGGGMTITFSPTIQVSGAGDVRGQVDQALQMGFEQFERLMRQYEQRTRRRGYGDIS